MINVLFISRRKEVHSAGHSVYRPAKENDIFLFFLIFLIPKTKELIALVISLLGYLLKVLSAVSKVNNVLNFKLSHVQPPLLTAPHGVFHDKCRSYVSVH